MIQSLYLFLNEGQALLKIIINRYTCMYVAQHPKTSIKDIANKLSACL